VLQYMVFWVMTMCNDVVGYQCFRGPCCLCLKGEVNGTRKGEHKRGVESVQGSRKQGRRVIVAVLQE
jgi:hypothetical protein